MGTVENPWLSKVTLAKPSDFHRETELLLPELLPVHLLYRWAYYKRTIFVLEKNDSWGFGVLQKNEEKPRFDRASVEIAQG